MKASMLLILISLAPRHLSAQSVREIKPIPAPPRGGFCGLVCASQIMKFYGKECNSFDDKNDWLDRTNGVGYYYNLGLEECSPKDVGQWLCNEAKKCPANCQCVADRNETRNFNGSISCKQHLTEATSSNQYCPLSDSGGKCQSNNNICGVQGRCPGDDANCSTPTWQPALQAFFEAHGLKTHNGRTLFDNKTGQVPENRFNEFLSYVRRGYPVIIHVRGHYLLIIDYDDANRELTFTDSRHAKVGTVSYSDFKYTNNSWWAKWVGCDPACHKDQTVMDAWDGRFLAVWE